MRQHANSIDNCKIEHNQPPSSASSRQASSAAAAVTATLSFNCGRKILSRTSSSEPEPALSILLLKSQDQKKKNFSGHDAASRKAGKHCLLQETVAQNHGSSGEKNRSQRSSEPSGSEALPPSEGRPSPRPSRTSFGLRLIFCHFTASSRTYLFSPVHVARHYRLCHPSSLHQAPPPPSPANVQTIQSRATAARYISVEPSTQRLGFFFFFFSFLKLINFEIPSPLIRF